MPIAARRRDIGFLLAGVLAIAVLVPRIARAADPEGAYQFAEHLMRDGMYDLAARELQDYIANYPSSSRAAEAWLLLARAYESRNAGARAADTYQAFIVKFPQDVRVRELWLKSADLRARAGQRDEAARSYLDLAAAYSESEFADDALLGAGACLIETGDFARAEQALGRLLERYPQSNVIDRGRILLARIALARGDARTASSAIMPIADRTAFSGEVADALSLAVDASLALDRVADARRLSDRLIQQAPGDDRTWRARLSVAGYLLARADDPGAEDALNQAAELYKEIARRASSASLGEQALFDLARLRERQENRALALQNWQEFLERFPASSRRSSAMLGLGRSQIANGDDRAGIFTLEDVLTAYPDSAQAEQALGELAAWYLRRGDATSALAYFERRHARMADGPARRRLLVRIAELREDRLGEPEQARAIYAGLAAGNDEAAALALFGLGRTQRRLNRMDEAEDAYGQIVRKFPAHPLAAAARDSLTLIRQFLRPDLSGAMLAVVALEADQLAAANPEAARRERMLAVAKMKVDFLRDYEGAIALLDRYLAASGAASPDEAEHLLATSWLRLATKARIRRDAEGAEGARRQALAALARLAERYPTSDRADDAYIETTEAALAAGDSASRAVRIREAYRDFSARYPTSDRRDFVLVRLAESAIARSGGGSPDEALRQFDEALRIAPNGQVLDAALRGSAMILTRQGDRAEARARLERLIAERPLSPLVPGARSVLAELLMADGQPLAAARELEKLLGAGTVSRDSTDIRRRLVVAYEAIGAAEQVLPVAGALVRTGSPAVASWGARRLAAAYVALGRPDDAERALATELAARPGAPDADSLTILRARLLFSRRRLDAVPASLAGFDRAFPRSRYVPEAWRMLADAQVEVGTYEDALASYRRVVSARADDRAARMGEVVCLYRLGRADEAKARERALRTLGRPSAEDEVRLAMEQAYAILRTNDYDGAIAAFAAVAERHPASEWADDALFAEGKAAVESGRIEPAVQAWGRLITAYPASPLRMEAAFELGNAYHQAQFFEQAAEMYRRALDMDSTSRFAPDALWNLAIALEQLQRFDQALGLLHTYIAKYPNSENSSRVWVKIAEDLVGQGEFRDAIAAYEEALERVTGTDEIEARFGLGEAYYALGDYRLAIIEWLKLAYHGQTQSRWAVTALFRAAKANEKMGQVEDARTLYRKIIAMQGESSDMGRAAALQLMALNATVEGESR